MTSAKTAKRLCQKCSFNGIDSPLQLFQLNDDDAILMCKNVDCTFMSSTKWESLIVKRDIFSLRSSFSKKQSYSSGGSLKSSQSSPLPHRTTDFPSRPSTPATEPSSSQIKSQLLKETQSFDIGSLSSSSSKDFVEERKTLVPIAPFLCGHAHTFSAFELKKFQKNKISNFNTSTSFLDLDIAKPTDFQCISGDKRDHQITRKRKASDLEYSSRPGFESTQSNLPLAKRTNKIQKITKLVVPVQTLRKIVDGTLQIKVTKNNFTKQSNSNDIVKSDTNTKNLSDCVDKASEHKPQETSKCSDQIRIHCNSLQKCFSDKERRSDS